MAKKIRIFQIAKDLNISHLDIIKFLKKDGVEVSSHMAPISSDDYVKILKEFSKEKLQVDRLRKEKARKEVQEHNKEKTSNDSLDSSTLASAVTNDSEVVQSPKEVLPIEEKVEIDEKKENLDENTTSRENKKIATKVDSSSGIGLKILERPSSKDESNSPEVQKAATKVDLQKLKRIDISDIADKIDQFKKSKSAAAADSKNTLKHSMPIKPGVKASKKKYKKKEKELIEKQEGKVIKLPEFTTVDELAQSMEVKAQDVIMSCMGLGLMVTINQRLDMDTMIMVCDEFGFELKAQETYEEEINSIEDSKEDLEKAVSRAPVVTIMGHVDHGKTSLLDYIRNTNVVAGESGKITQHIGAYEVELPNKKKITFLDTPGHAAFTAMRARGAQVTDVAVIIIAANDGIKPQTIEAIDHSKAANVPLIIAINKIDVTGANVDNVKKQLSEINILVEDWGGKVQCAEVSAKSGKGIDNLLEKIILEADILDLKANRDTIAQGTIIESKLDKGLGPIATLLVQKGTLKVGDWFLCGSQASRVRSLRNERGIKIETGYPSDPVQVLGFESVPNAGEFFNVFKEEKEAKKIASEREHIKRIAQQSRFKKISLDEIGKKISQGEVKDLNILIKGDVDGSIEALSDSLMELSTDEVKINIIHKSVGMINESDVTLASASKAIIVAFNVSTTQEAKRTSKSFGVDIRNYSIIYKAIEEIKLALEGLLEPDKVEEILGAAEILDKFKISKLGLIAGCKVTQGRISAKNSIRIKREEDILFDGKIASLKRFQDDVKEVLEGNECGIAMDGFNKFDVGDMIEAYQIKEIKRTL